MDVRRFGHALPLAAARPNGPSDPVGLPVGLRGDNAFDLLEDICDRAYAATARTARRPKKHRLGRGRSVGVGVGQARDALEHANHCGGNGARRPFPLRGGSTVDGKAGAVVSMPPPSA